MPSLFLEIALIVASTLVSISAVVVGVLVSRKWIAFALGAVILLNGAAAVVQVVKVRHEHTREAEILTRKATLVKLLGDEIDKASQIEYGLETLMTRNAMTQPALDGFIAEIDPWRTRVGKDLERMLPGTYAASVFLSARGDFPGAFVVVGVGKGTPSVSISMPPGFYQYTHVRECRRSLTAILAAVDSFTRLAAEVKA